MKKVNFAVEDNIATVTLNRPEQLNSFDYETLVELETIVDSIALRHDIYAVIFTGAGNKAFSAGADLKERKHLSEQQAMRNVYKIRDVFLAIEQLPQPTIAAINGYALGGGLELALACDFRYATEQAKLGLTEVKWAIIPGAGGTQRLPRLIGVARAKELILTARTITANEAYEWGLLNKVVASSVLEEARALANEIKENGPLAVRQAKYAIQHGLAADLHTGLALETKCYEALIPTEDRVEALRAFQEKRKPNFRGK